MSDDLVEKVARAMCADAGFDQEQVMPNDGPRWRYYESQARAAIAAVAEWLDNSHKLDDDSRVSLALSKQLEAKG